MNTFTIGDSFTMASIPMRYPDAKLAEEILFEKDKIKGIWLSGEASQKIYDNVYVETPALNNQTTVEQIDEVNKPEEEKSN